MTGNATLMLGTIQFTPTTLSGASASSFDGQVKKIDTVGVLIKTSAGARLKPAEVTSPATMIWMSADYVLGTQAVAACKGSCPSLTAPSGTTQALLIRAAEVTQIATDTAITKG